MSDLKAVYRKREEEADSTTLRRKQIDEAVKFMAYNFTSLDPKLQRETENQVAELFAEIWRMGRYV